MKLGCGRYWINPQAQSEASAQTTAVDGAAHVGAHTGTSCRVVLSRAAVVGAYPRARRRPHANIGGAITHAGLGIHHRSINRTSPDGAAHGKTRSNTNSRLGRSAKTQGKN